MDKPTKIDKGDPSTWPPFGVYVLAWWPNAGPESEVWDGYCRGYDGPPKEPITHWTRQPPAPEEG